MNTTHIESGVRLLITDTCVGNVSKDDFIFQLMELYGHRKTTIGRIKSGERNLADVAGEVRAKRHVYFKHSQNGNVLSDIDGMKKQPSVSREKIRFVIATDFNQFVALDTRTNDTLDIEFNDLGKHFDFFLPWAGMEKAVYQGENPADVKAAEKMARLFDLIKADNFNDENKHDKQALHNLNVFLTRLLFCFFAEDTGIFKQNQFSGELESHTKVDGSDVADYLNRLFDVLNNPKDKRTDLPDYLANFEFVNGGLFADNIASPRFSTKSRKMLIECGSELDWSDINPDIFGSMIQAVVHPDQRGGMGMHYTSVTNIMKVIEPLFLDELYAELENIEDNIDPKLKPSRLRKLHDRIAEIKIFDPACGSGNFLIIAFKELRKLEMEIIKRLQELEQNENQDDLFGDIGLDSSFSRIKLSQFYGIELDDFAHEVAILSLWLAEHQMNVEFKAEFGECEASLPLKQSGNILCGNALSVEWENVCPNVGYVYICGNPPYLGQKMQSKAQKADLTNVFQEYKDYKTLDYISGWFYKAAKFINIDSKFAFVTTNSVNQGNQVGLLWNKVLKFENEIYFAYENFHWSNSAKNKAGVTCSIIGVRKKSSEPKYLYNKYNKRKVKNISPYLVEGPDTIVLKAKNPLSNLPKMVYGNMALDGGHLLFSKSEYDEAVRTAPLSAEFFLPTTGSKEFINDIPRYCLWIKDSERQKAEDIEVIKERVEACYNFRVNGGDVARTLQNRPHQFRYRHRAKTSQILIPLVSSERREYIPIGFVEPKTVIQQTAQVIYDPEPFILGVLSSKMHVAWVKAVCGRMRTDIAYSNVLCYNTFPIPDLSEQQKNELTSLSINLIQKREEFVGYTLAQLYDPKVMPDELRQVHHEIDLYVDALYQKSLFKNDYERLSVLLEKYSEMTGGHNA